MSKNNYKDLVDNSFKEHSETLKETHSKLSNNIELSSDLIFSSIKAGGTIFGVEMEEVLQILNI